MSEAWSSGRKAWTMARLALMRLARREPDTLLLTIKHQGQAKRFGGEECRPHLLDDAVVGDDEVIGRKAGHASCRRA